MVAAAADVVVIIHWATTTTEEGRTNPFAVLVNLIRELRDIKAG